jgi:hypothetical protein
LAAVFSTHLADLTTLSQNQYPCFACANELYKKLLNICGEYNKDLSVAYLISLGLNPIQYHLNQSSILTFFCKSEPSILFFWNAAVISWNNFSNSLTLNSPGHWLLFQRIST